MQIVSITSKGQATIPVSIRESMGLVPGRKVIFYEDENGEVTIKPVVDLYTLRGFIKTKRKFNIKAMEKAAEKQAVKEYLK